MKNGCCTKHPFKTGCLEFQKQMYRHLIFLAPFCNHKKTQTKLPFCWRFEVGNLVLIMWEADQDAKCFPEYYGALILQWGPGHVPGLFGGDDF